MATSSVAQGRENVVAQEQTSGKRRFSLTPYLFIAPHLIAFAIFVGFPFFFGLGISTFQYNYLRPDLNKFVGLDNYLNLFNDGSPQFLRFWNAFWNTGQFVLMSVPVLIVVPLMLAVLLNTKTPGRNLFRAIYFAPWVLSVAVVGILWWWIFQSSGGLINYYLKDLGLFTPRWLSTMPWAWIAILVCTVWWTLGFNMIIILAALQDIPGYLYEAASLDGATGIQQFFRITLPQLQPVLVFIVVTSVIASFNLFGQPFIMTGGGPAQSNTTGATEPVMLRIYREGFENNQQGTGAAMAFLIATVMIAISYANFRLFRQRD